jgi:hypothetical protein
MTKFGRASTLLVAIAAASMAGGCSTGQVAAPSPTPTFEPSSTAAPSAAPTATSRATLPTIGPGEQNLEAGTYIFGFPQMDAPDKPFPRVLITVPDGWASYKGFGVAGPRTAFVGFWSVVEVYAHPCHWLGPKIHSGPTVDELAATLAKVPLRNATSPVDVTVDGYDGKYLEWSVPGDIDFSDCDVGGGVHYFESWTGDSLWKSDTTDRYQQGPGQVDRLWILDVEGRRLVIDATYMPGETEQDRAELAQVVDSIRFER